MHPSGVIAGMRLTLTHSTAPRPEDEISLEESRKRPDAWFAGWQPSVVAVVWIGYDQPRKLGSNETGSVSALPIWMGYMSEALKGVPEVFMPVPDGGRAAVPGPDAMQASRLSVTPSFVPFAAGICSLSNKYAFIESVEFSSIGFTSVDDSPLIALARHTCMPFSPSPNTTNL